MPTPLPDLGSPGPTTFLFTGGTIVTGSPTIPDLESGDVLVGDGLILAVGPDLRSSPEFADRIAEAVVIDTRGRILAPGFVDTHRHAWQSQLRRSIPDVGDLVSYVTSTLGGAAPAYTPEDMLIGTRLAALAAIDAGITTMLDFSHNARSAAHTDAAVTALIDTGIRGVHASMAPHFGDWDRQWPADLGRVVSRYQGAESGRITVQLAALATDEIAGEHLAYGPHLASVAESLDIGVSIDAVFGASSSRALLDWARRGILHSKVMLIHATGLTDEAWRAVGDTGATVALAPTSEPQIGLESGVPAIDEALAVGVRPGLSIDVEVALAGDMFTQMRALLAVQRMRAVENSPDRANPSARITTRDVLDFATLHGAHTLGLADRTGSVEAGKRADLILVNAESIATMPLNDAVGTLVLGASPADVDAVLVDGVPRKWAGSLVGVDVDAVRDEVTASRDAILRRIGAAAERQAGRG
ncbi:MULTISPECIES: amidohydrolase family protein [Actinoalloteichus]|uniref:Cytosine deaminase-like metal-dependent hydrolase n=1 Tax=Actinoalloteichus fjordicus TaxID=1612552 RepID=A0AAC9LCM3_9PSEU|nr:MULTISPECIES: amidohydrolase family protein [Actinoalloteichus]APU15498.1 cytosine deaminase-like metal-dependent hydrolase [Actinoalloteichus fjordicus]APU21565.1 cytosine deaminase-like metal-dependent hydrolase [Actinoalloteichus sp. GBA129-24]